jgi:hypothetical protein
MNSGASTAIAVAAAQRAEEAKKIACEGVLQSFDPKGATVEIIKGYADCVNLLHPNDMLPSDIILIKFTLISCFIAGIAAGIYFGKEWGILNGVVSFVVGFVLTGCGFIILGLLIMAIKFIAGA